MCARKRLVYIDAVKGFAMIAVIMMHITFGHIFNLWASFAVPCFFFLSGFLYRPRPALDVAAKKAKSLLLPYFAAGTFFCVAYCVAHGVWEPSVFLRFFRYEDGLYTIPYGVALWFLPALFICFTVYALAEQFPRRPECVSAVVLVLWCAGFVLGRMYGDGLFLRFDAAIRGLLYFHAGRAFSTAWTRTVPAPTSLLLTLLLFLSVCIIFLQTVLEGSIFETALLPVVWIAFSMVLVFLARRLCAKRSCEVACEYIEGVGRMSMVYLCFHHALIVLFTAWLPVDFSPPDPFMHLFMSVCMLLIVLSAMVPVCYFFKGIEGWIKSIY